MANQFINAMSDLWNSAGTTYAAIKMNVTNAASASTSKLLLLQIGSVEKFSVDKVGNVLAVGSITGAGVTSSGASLPSANDSAALGASGTAWSDLFLASGGVINWLASDVTITHAANALAFAGASSGYTFDASIKPLANDSAPLGIAATAWSDLFLATGAVVNYGNGNAILTHSDLALTVAPGDLRVTTAGTTAASVVTVGGTQTLTGKTLQVPTLSSALMTSPTISGAPTAGAATWTNLGAVTTCDINGGTIDGTVIGATTPAAITGTTVSGASASFSTVTGTTSITSPTATHATKVTAGIVETAQIVQATGTSIIIAPAAGLNTIIFRPRGQADATGAVTIDNVGTIVTPGAITADGNINGEDFHSVRTASPTTGVIFLGNTGARYLFYDGTNYSMPGAGLTLGGAISASGALTLTAAANYINLADTDQGQTRYIHHNGGLIGFLSSGGGWILRVDDGGALWSAQFGDFNTYWENRCAAHQNAAVQRVVDVTANVVGSNGMLCRDGGGGAMGADNVIAGGSLAWSNAAGNINGRPGGSWRCLGYVQSGSTTTGASTMWHRYA